MPRSDINPEKGNGKKVRKARKNRQEREAGKQKNAQHSDATFTHEIKIYG